MRRNISALLVLGAAAILLAALAVAQQGQASKQMTMEVTIVATGKDNAPVQDLTVKDISIKDNNKKQEIVAFEKVTAGTPAEAGKPAIHNIVLLDVLNTTYRDLPENRVEMLKVVGELSKADNLTFLMLRQGLRIVDDPGMQPPTLLRKMASQGIQGLEGAKPDLSPYDWVFSDQLGLMQLFTPAGVFDRRRIEDSMGALRTIASNYQNRSGRKNLIWISQGFPITMGQTPSGYDAQSLGNQSQSRGQTASGYDASASSAKSSQGDSSNPANRADDLTAFSKDMDFTDRMLTNANVAIYPIDSRYLSINDTQSSDRTTMEDLANGTGGRAFLSRRDVANAVREALDDTRVVYVAKYAISDLKFDGKSHAIKVETSKKDTKLRYRGTYYSPSASPAQK